MDSEVYILKVALKGMKRIWRTIAIRGDQTLNDLHETIFVAFDRHDTHLYSFYLTTGGGMGRGRLRDAPKYSHPLCFQEGHDPLDTNHFNAEERIIKDLSLTLKQKFEYLFDFGDEWWHEITVENVERTQPGVKYPLIIERRGESPPQYTDPEDE